MKIEDYCCKKEYNVSLKKKKAKMKCSVQLSVCAPKKYGMCLVYTTYGMALATSNSHSQVLRGVLFDTAV